MLKFEQTELFPDERSAAEIAAAKAEIEARENERVDPLEDLPFFDVHEREARATVQLDFTDTCK